MRKYLDLNISDTHFTDYDTPCQLGELVKKIAKQKERAEWVIGRWRHGFWGQRDTQTIGNLEGDVFLTQYHHSSAS